jgi:uncharacterized membrane protein (DUF2068 family)
MMSTTPVPVRKPAKHISSSERWIIAIGVWKLLETLFFIVLGVAAAKLIHEDLVDVVARFLADLRLDPEGRFASLLLDRVALIDPHRLRQISIAIFAGAALHAIEGIGLVLRKVWAEYVTLIITASFLPWEIFEILRHTTWVRVVLLLVNIVVVAYLIFYVQTSARRRKEQEES